MTPTEKVKIMLVDDSSTNNLLYESIFESEGYEVVVCDSGRNALKKISAKERPDIILLDLMMPGIDGFDVLIKLKENPETQNIPVIILTAKVDTESESKAFELGAIDYIIKPIGIYEITEEIRAILSGEFEKKPKIKQ